VCEELTKLGLQPCFAQEIPSLTSSLYQPKPCNPFYEPVVSIAGNPQARRLLVFEVFELAAQRFDSWLQQYIEEFTVAHHIPASIFSCISPAAAPSTCSGSSNGLSHVAAARHKAKLECDIVESIRLNVASEVIHAVKGAVAEQFVYDDEGDIQLFRFEAIARLLMDSAEECLMQSARCFNEDVARRVRALFDWSSGCHNLENVWGTGVRMQAALCSSVKETVIQARRIN
jgi:hypothetical protein